MNLHEAFEQIAARLDLDPGALMTYAAEDNIGGFHSDETRRQWNTGAIWAVEGQFLYALIRALRPARVLEVGIGWGCSTTHILAALERNGEGELVSLDPSPYGGDRLPFASGERWTPYRVDALGWLREHPDETFDLVVEDGPHSYEFGREFWRQLNKSHLRLALSHDAGHFLVGNDVRRGMNDGLGDCDVLNIEPSDCGWGYWVGAARPAEPVIQFTNMESEKRERILYLPIIEPGRFHDVALTNKRGLREALRAYGEVQQLDYQAIARRDLFGEILRRADDVQPTLLLTQLHGPDYLTVEHLMALHQRYPAMRTVNWSGDSWLHSLTAPAMLALAREFDLWLVAAPDVLPVYAENGIHAAFWQIAYEEPVGDLPDVPAYDVVFLANVINEQRRTLMEFLRGLNNVSVGIYGDWEQADGSCQYDFGMGEALYRNARIAIADNVYPDQQNYVSNRPIQALMAGGALLLHQHVARMDVLLGIEAGTHYVKWRTFEELERAIRTYLKKGNEPRRRKMVKAGQEFARAHHTYAERARQLFEELLPEVARV